MRIAIAIACALLVAASPCGAETVHGSGRAQSVERAVSGFHGLAVSVPGHIELVAGTEEGMSVQADDNVLAILQTVVDHGVLRIRFPRDVAVVPRTPIRMTVRARSIDSIALAGSATLEAPQLEAGRLAVELAGSAQAVLPQLAVRELRLHASGHCHAMAAGRADALEIHVAGSGEINASRLEAARAAVRIAGSAQVAAWVRESLEARITGSGSLRYFGDPALTRKVLGSGSVERLGAAPP